jgi:hypothetical protein
MGRKKKVVTAKEVKDFTSEIFGPGETHPKKELKYTLIVGPLTFSNVTYVFSSGNFLEVGQGDFVHFINSNGNIVASSQVVREESSQANAQA